MCSCNKFQRNVKNPISSSDNGGNNDRNLLLFCALSIFAMENSVRLFVRVFKNKLLFIIFPGMLRIFQTTRTFT